MKKITLKKTLAGVSILLILMLNVKCMDHPCYQLEVNRALASDQLKAAQNRYDAADAAWRTCISSGGTCLQESLNRSSAQLFLTTSQNAFNAAQKALEDCVNGR